MDTKNIHKLAYFLTKQKLHTYTGYASMHVLTIHRHKIDMPCDV